MIALAALAAAARLVVFQQDGSLAAKDFAATSLPRLHELAAARGVALEVRDPRAGAPAEVHATPLIVYQDGSGRSIFRGRYSDLDRIGQFLRTVKSGPLTNADTPSENMAVWRRGRAVVIAPIKITALSGTIPGRHDEQAFAERARKAILSGFKRFRFEDKVVAGPSDRAFYMDFHPYRDAAGKLFVSTAIYSGFNCVEPVFRNFDEPFSGEFARMDEVFARAGKELEDRVAQLAVSSNAGDAFDPVSDDAPKRTWDALGLALPPAPSTKGSTAETPVPLPRRLVIAEARPDDPPRLEFRFLPPLDGYNGEVRTVSGTITLGDRSRLRGASGTLDAATASVTMGDKTLDKELKTTILKTGTFPGARFVIDPVDAADAPLVPGVPAPFTATGRLEMLGASVPLSVNAQAEAGTDDEGAPRLDVRATFRVRLGEAFGLKGPDGPSPANDTLEFSVRLDLRPEPGSAAVTPSASR